MYGTVCDKDLSPVAKYTLLYYSTRLYAIVLYCTGRDNYAEY